jgi:hypothetical protein
MTLIPTSSALAALLFVPTLAASAQVQYQERAAAVGLVHQTTVGMDRIGDLFNMLDWVQTGSGMGDLDGDGLSDVIVCGRFEGTRLFLNNGNGFVDATAGSGLDTDSLDNCVTLGDVDGDGDLDVYIGVNGPHEGPTQSYDRLLFNDGQAHFTEVRGVIDLTGGGHTIFAKFFDLDYDGDLDLYACQFDGTRNKLYINTGLGGFVERGALLGADVGGSTHVASIADMDGDGVVDILLGSDWVVTEAASMKFNSGDVFLHGTGDGHFVDMTVGSGFDLIAPSVATTMGMTIGDVNYDGLMDVYRSEFGAQILSINNGWPGGGAFVEDQVAFGVDSPLVPDPSNPGTMGNTVGWGTRLMNLDHDLWLDLFEVTGNVSAGSPRNQRSFAFLGQGPSQQFHFADATEALGLNEQIDDRGLCIGDPDQDGDLDILIMPAAGPLRYLESNASTTPDGWLEVVAQTETSAPGGFGTKVSFTDAAGFPHVAMINTDGSTASHSEALAHFGLGSEPAVDLTVEFPSGMTKVLAGTLPNQRITVVEPPMFLTSDSTLRSAATGFPEPLTVWVAAFDSAGTALDASASVTIDVPGLNPTSPVQSLGGNFFKRTFAAAAAAGDFRVTASFNGWSPRIHPTVTYHGLISTSVSTQLCVPDCVRVGSADPFLVTVTPRDASGAVIGPGLGAFMMISGPGGFPITPMVDLGNGSYELQLPAPTAVGKLAMRFGIVAGGVVTVLDAKTFIESAGPATGTDSLFYEEVPHFEFASTPNQLKVRVSPRDAAGLRLGTGGVGTLSFMPAVGSVAVIERTDLAAVHADGTYDFVLERPPGTPNFSGAGTLTFLLDGVAVFSQPYSF